MNWPIKSAETNLHLHTTGIQRNKKQHHNLFGKIISYCFGQKYSELSTVQHEQDQNILTSYKKNAHTLQLPFHESLITCPFNMNQSLNSNFQGNSLLKFSSTSNLSPAPFSTTIILLVFHTTLLLSETPFAAS